MALCTTSRIKNLLFGSLNELDVSEIKDSKVGLNKKIINERLEFDPDDINYIIVRNEIKRDSIISILEKTKSKYPYEAVRRLTRRIISVEQIRTDF